MDFSYESDDTVRQELREFLDRELPDSMRDSGFGWDYDRDFNIAFTSWQEEHLGDASDADLDAFADELFWANLDLRTTGPTGLVAKILSIVGTDEQKTEYLPKFVGGGSLICLGYTEPDSGSDVASASTRAIRDGDEWVINGQKMYTSLAGISDYVFLLTRTSTEVPKHKGLTMFIVPLTAPGVEVKPIETLRGHPTYMTYYTDVRVPDSTRVGDVDGGWAVMRVSLDAEHSAGEKIALEARLLTAVGWGNRLNHLLKRTVLWAQTARTEDGIRMIDDPMMRRALARIAIDVEIIRLLTGRNDADATKPGVGNGTKLFQTEAYVRATSSLLEIAGPIGLLEFTSGAAAAEGWIEYSFRDAPVTTIAGGSSEVQRDIIAERRLGLPTSRRAASKSA
ncbi:MAG: acyl-CoA dehydrogenase family protein [bacterium]|nr:acyl-CoA dehydrogenase family protein [bacterium]